MALYKVFPSIMPFKQKCENVDESTLQHLRYGHLNFHGLKLLQKKKKEIVLRLPYVSLEKKICEGCILWQNA